MIKIKTANIILYCTHWAETVAFYRSLFDFSVLTSLDWFIEFEMSETARLSIADESRASIDSNEGKGLTLTFEVDDIQDTRSKLVRLGLENVTVKDHPWGAQVIHVYDPEGNRVEFWVAAEKYTTLKCEAQHTAKQYCHMRPLRTLLKCQKTCIIR